MKLFNLLRYLIEAVAGALFGSESHSKGRYPENPPDFLKNADSLKKWDNRKERFPEEQKYLDLVAKNMPETYFDEFGRVCYRAKKDGDHGN